MNRMNLVRVLKTQGILIFMGLASFNMTSCKQQNPKDCTDAFMQDYQSMKTEFKNLYSQKAGTAELENFRSSLDKFLANHKDVKCKDSSGATLDPTAEVKAVVAALPKFVKPATPISSVKSLQIKVVYGEDNRVDVGDAPANYQEWARSTAAMMSSNEWDSDYNIISDTLGKAFTLCPDQRFYNQFSSATCSGFLVGPDILVTAGHCVDESSCGSYQWVFGFTNEVTKLDPKNIFECKEVLGHALSSDQKDFSVIRLDRKVTGRKFFRPRTSGAIKKGDGVVVIGHPSGLPTKISDGAHVRDSSNANFFVTDLDTFGGNSGSVVVNQSTGMAEGILVRGDTDYNVVTYSDGSRCRQVNVCAQDGCQGEEVTKMTIVEGLPAVASFDEVYAGIFKNQSYPKISEGLPVPFYGSSFGDYTIGGLKFLDECGIHYYKSEQPSQWENSFVGACSSNDLAAVVSSFDDLLYL